MMQAGARKSKATQMNTDEGAQMKTTRRDKAAISVYGREGGQTGRDPCLRQAGFIRCAGSGLRRKAKLVHIFLGDLLGSGVDRDAFEDFADFCAQGFQVEGLLQEGHAALEHAVAENAVVSVTGDVQDF